MTPQIATLRIGSRLMANETALDTTIADMADLIGEIARARIATGAAAATGQVPLTLAMAALTKQVDARRDVVRLHESLRRIAETSDFPTDCPKETFTGAEADEVTRVAA